MGKTIGEARASCCSTAFAVFAPSGVSVLGRSAFSSGLYADQPRVWESNGGQASSPPDDFGGASGDTSSEDFPLHGPVTASSREGSFKRSATSDGHNGIDGQSHKMRRATLPYCVAAATPYWTGGFAAPDQLLPLAPFPSSEPTRPPTAILPMHVPDQATPPSPPSSPPDPRTEAGCASRTTPKQGSSSTSHARMHPLTLRFIDAPFETLFRETHFSANLDLIISALAVFISSSFAQLIEPSFIISASFAQLIEPGFNISASSSHLIEPDTSCTEGHERVRLIAIIVSQAACLTLAIWLRHGAILSAGYRYFDVAYSLAFVWPPMVMMLHTFFNAVSSTLPQSCRPSSSDGPAAISWGLGIFFMRYLCVDMRLQVSALCVAIYCWYLSGNVLSEHGESELRRAIGVGVCGGYLLEGSIRGAYAKRRAVMASSTMEAAMEAGKPAAAHGLSAQLGTGQVEVSVSQCQVKHAACTPLDLEMSLLPCTLWFSCAATEDRARAYAFTESYRYEVSVHVLCLAYGVWLRYVDLRSTLCAWLPEMSVTILWLIARLWARWRGDTAWAHKLHDATLGLGVLAVACIEMFYRPQLSEDMTLPRFLLLPLVLLRVERAFNASVHLALVATLVCLSTLSPGWSVYGQPHDHRQLCMASLLATSLGYLIDKKTRNAFTEQAKARTITVT